MFGTRQVSIRITAKAQEKPVKYWNLPENVLKDYDKDMVGSKRNIIMAHSKPIYSMTFEDIVLRLRKS
jgi:hypothetical protein